MEDWFNKRNGSDERNSNDERKVGRIFQDDSYIPGKEFLNGFSSDPSSYRENNSVEHDTQNPADDYFARTFGAPSDKRRTSQSTGKTNEKYDDTFPTGEIDLSELKAQIEEKMNNEPNMYEEETDGDIDRTSNKRKKSKGKPKWKKIIISVVAIVLVIAIALGSYAYTLFSKVNFTPDEHKENQYISNADLVSDKNVYNILLIGTDERATQANYRSDTMILVSLDKNTKKIKLTSFLRDTWVYIPAKDKSAKLNATCSYGGPQMVIDTLEYHFKVKIDKYVMINFDVFKTVINDLGGITLTITEAEAANITKEAGFNCKPGTRTVKGRTALWYARIRHLDSDFNRTARQRKVIQAVVDKAKESDIKTLANVLNDVLPEIQTDINKTEMASLGVNALLKYINYDIEEQQIPAKGTWSNAWVGSQQVLKADLDENAKILKKFIYE